MAEPVEKNAPAATKGIVPNGRGRGNWAAGRDLAITQQNVVSQEVAATQKADFSAPPLQLQCRRKNVGVLPECEHLDSESRPREGCRDEESEKGC
jgi:hypothetical protein